MGGSEVQDVVIIGAGLYGIQAARTYLEVHPRASLVVFEAAIDIGGVWSKSRNYDDFYTQTPFGIAEFSDRPLKVGEQNDSYYGFFPAIDLTLYLESYVRDHVYNGKSLLDRISFRSEVRRLYKKDGLWVVKVKDRANEYRTPKVIDASGLTSIPNIPTIPGSEKFRGRLIHHKDFGQSDILESTHLDSVAVLGGAKSAADVAYAAAKAGKKVSWIIRKSGSGPCAFIPAKGQGPYKNSNESFYTRMTTSFLASIFQEPSWWSSLLHTSRLGQELFWRIWRKMNDRATDLVDYNRVDGRGNGYGNLRPDTDIFWQNDSTSINQREGFFETIAQRVQVHREDITNLEYDRLVLGSGTTIAIDALVYATGWKSHYPYIDTSLASALGLSVPEAVFNVEDAKKWQHLEQEACKEVLDRFPILSSPPRYYPHAFTQTPFRLYRNMLPVEDHSIVFVGKALLGNNFRNAEVQALWAVAVLDRSLHLPSTSAMEVDIAKVVAWNRSRYLSKGSLGNWLYFDMVPYTDALLAQLGLTGHRKTFWRDFFETCWAHDLRGLIPEYKSKCKTGNDCRLHDKDDTPAKV